MLEKPENRFHETDTYYNEARYRQIHEAVNKNKITKDDSDLISEFISEVIATNHVCSKRSYKLAYVLVGWRRFLGPFKDNTTADIFRGMELMQSAGFKKNTISDYNRFLKRFSLWMIENGHAPKLDEKKIRKITGSRPDAMTKTAADLLSEDEIKKLIDVCQNSKDRALIMMLYEGAFRVGEIGNLTWSQVKFSEYNITVNVDDKTGKPRMIPLYKSVPYLSSWRQDYPGEIYPDAFVFITRNKEQLQYAGLVKQLNKIAKRAGIEKHITPHTFRHSSITQMIRENIGDAVIKKIAWGTTETDMFKTYAHLVDADIETAMALRNGVLTPEKMEKSKVLEPRQCPRCYAINRPDQEFCGKCGLALTGDAALDLSTATKEIEETDLYKRLYEKIMADIASKQAQKSLGGD